MAYERKPLPISGERLLLALDILAFASALRETVWWAREHEIGDKGLMESLPHLSVQAVRSALERLQLLDIIHNDSPWYFLPAPEFQGSTVSEKFAMESPALFYRVLRVNAQAVAGVIFNAEPLLPRHATRHDADSERLAIIRRDCERFLAAVASGEISPQMLRL